MSDDSPIGAPTRARVQALAALGVPLADIMQVHGYLPNGTLMDAAQFRQHCARELGLGYAQANIEVCKALFEQAVSGKHSTVTLAWAKHKLDWNETPAPEVDDDAALATSAAALAALQQLLEQLAATKAGSAAHAAALANGGEAQPASTGDELA